MLDEFILEQLDRIEDEYLELNQKLADLTEQEKAEQVQLNKYLDADDLDPLKLALVDTFMTDLYVTESSEAVVLYWIEGVRADSEYMCIYISSYCECYDAEEPYSYSIAAVLKTALSPTTDYCAVSSNRWVSYETATMENFPAAIRETCSPVPTEDRTVHEVLVK